MRVSPRPQSRLVLLPGSGPALKPRCRRGSGGSGDEKLPGKRVNLGIISDALSIAVFVPGRPPHFPNSGSVIESTESLLHLIPSPLYMLANDTYRFIRSVTRLTPIKLCFLNAQVNTTHKSKGQVVAGFVVKGCSSRRHYRCYKQNYY